MGAAKGNQAALLICLALQLAGLLVTLRCGRQIMRGLIAPLTSQASIRPPPPALVQSSVNDIGGAG